MEKERLEDGDAENMKITAEIWNEEEGKDKSKGRRGIVRMIKMNERKEVD